MFKKEHRNQTHDVALTGRDLGPVPVCSQLRSVIAIRPRCPPVDHRSARPLR